MKYLVIFEDGDEGVKLYEFDLKDGWKLEQCHRKYIGCDTWHEESWLNAFIENATALDTIDPLENYTADRIIITGWVD